MNYPLYRLMNNQPTTADILRRAVTVVEKKFYSNCLLLVNVLNSNEV